MFKDFYKGKKVLVTGHTGFKGTWLTLWLKSLGAEICGYSLAPNTSPSMFEELKVSEGIKSVIGNILDQDLLNRTFEEFKPEIVFHLAAQPIVRLSYKEPVSTYETNVIGSLKVLEAARKCGTVKAFVNVTTDKVYENNESGRNFEENNLMFFIITDNSQNCRAMLSMQVYETIETQFKDSAEKFAKHSEINRLWAIDVLQSGFESADK